MPRGSVNITVWTSRASSSISLTKLAHGNTSLSTASPQNADEIVHFIIETMKKYARYEVATNIPGEDLETESWREAFGQYSHAKAICHDSDKVTLWGVSEMGEYTCIMSNAKTK